MQNPDARKNKKNNRSEWHGYSCHECFYPLPESMFHLTFPDSSVRLQAPTERAYITQHNVQTMALLSQQVSFNASFEGGVVTLDSRQENSNKHGLNLGSNNRKTKQVSDLQFSGHSCVASAHHAMVDRVVYSS